MPSTQCYPFRYVSRETITANTLYTYQRFLLSFCLFAFPFSLLLYQFGKIRLFAFLSFYSLSLSTLQKVSRTYRVFAFWTLVWSSGKSNVLHYYVPFWLSPSLQSMVKLCTLFGYRLRVVLSCTSCKTFGNIPFLRSGYRLSLHPFESACLSFWYCKGTAKF